MICEMFNIAVIKIVLGQDSVLLPCYRCSLFGVQITDTLRV